MAKAETAARARADAMRWNLMVSSWPRSATRGAAAVADEQQTERHHGVARRLRDRRDDHVVERELRGVAAWIDAGVVVVVDAGDEGRGRQPAQCAVVERLERIRAVIGAHAEVPAGRHVLPDRVRPEAKDATHADARALREGRE